MFDTVPLRVLVTGSRDHVWTPDSTTALMTAATMALKAYGLPTHMPILVHGGAKGADVQASNAARLMGWGTEEHQAQWDTYGRKAGPIRNAHMVSLGAGVCVAFPSAPKGQGSRGTWDCIDRAAKAGIPVLIVWKDQLWGYGQAVEKLGVAPGEACPLSMSIAY